MKSCVFAGTFDPITIGHEDIVKQCLAKFDKVILVVGKNPNKSHFLCEKDRIELCKQAFLGQENLEIVAFSQIENEFSAYLKKQGVKTYIRGIRNKKDMQMEDQMQEKNAKLYPFITTEYIYADKQFEKVSSSLVRELIDSGASYLQYIPLKARDKMQEIIKRLKNQ